MPAVARIALSALLLVLYARGGWLLGFVALVPWMDGLARVRSLPGALACGLTMSLAFVGATFGWFATSIADYNGLPAFAALTILLATAPLLQPQILASALAWHVPRRVSPPLRTTAAIAAWIATEWSRLDCSATRAGTDCTRPSCCARPPTPPAPVD